MIWLYKENYMSEIQFVKAGYIYTCTKCKKQYGKVNILDGTGKIGEEDYTMDEYKQKTDEMEKMLEKSGVKLLTLSLDDVICNECLGL